MLCFKLNGDGRQELLLQVGEVAMRVLNGEMLARGLEPVGVKDPTAGDLFVQEKAQYAE